MGLNWHRDELSGTESQVALLWWKWTPGLKPMCALPYLTTNLPFFTFFFFFFPVLLWCEAFQLQAGFCCWVTSCDGNLQRPKIKLGSPND